MDIHAEELYTHVSDVCFSEDVDYVYTCHFFIQNLAY